MASELAEVSARLGADLRLVQGAGGNTSTKTGDQLLVKASGTCLRDALTDDIFVELSIAHVLARVADEREDFETTRTGRGMKPSIETSMHAILPDPVVLHVHSVNTISWAVRRQGRSLVNSRLEGLDWAWVEYARPGLPLTRAIQRARRDHPSANVLVLANHGLVVTGASVRDAHERLVDVEARLIAPTLRVPLPLMPLPAAERLPAGTRLPHNPAVHSLAAAGMMDAEVLSGVLYPDHVVFIGDHVPRLEAVDAPISRREEAKCVLVTDQGVLLLPGATRGTEAMLECLALLAPTLPPAADLVFLDQAQIAELVGWDAEKLRQKLMQAREGIE